MLDEPVCAPAPVAKRLLAPDSPRQDHALVELRQLRVTAMVEDHAHRLAIDRLHRNDVLFGVGEAPRHVGVDLRPPGPLHVVGGHRFAVGPNRVRAKSQRQRQMVV